MQLRILVVGKLKNAGLEALVAEWQKRSRVLLPIEVVTVRDLDALRTKAERPRVLLDERGSQFSSEQLAQFLGEQRDRGIRKLDFAVGDAHGFSAGDRSAADRLWSLSKLTLPHRLVQVIVVEQLYRAGTILAHHPYHHV